MYKNSVDNLMQSFFSVSYQIIC